MFEDSLDQLRSKLEAKEKRIQKLRDELSSIEGEKDEAIVIQRQMEEITEAQEAELSRIRAKMPGGDMAKYWENKLAVEEQLIREFEEQSKVEEDTIATLTTKVKDLSSKVDAQAKDIEMIKDNISEGGAASDDEDNGPVSTYVASDGAVGFHQRLQAMRKGDLMQVLVKEKFKSVFVILTADGSGLALAQSEKKKPYQTIPLDDVQAVSYPTHLHTSKGTKSKDLGKDFMKFSIDTASHESLVFLTANQNQLLVWCLGIQNLTAKPGQVLLDKGTLLWNRAQNKLAWEAAERNITSQQMVAEAIKLMLPEDEHQFVEDDNDEE